MRVESFTGQPAREADTVEVKLEPSDTGISTLELIRLRESGFAAGLKECQKSCKRAPDVLALGVHIGRAQGYALALMASAIGFLAAYGAMFGFTP